MVVALAKTEGLTTAGLRQGDTAAFDQQNWRQIELTAHALVSDRAGRLLLTKRDGSTDSQWQLPGGRVREGETCVGSLVSRLHLEFGLLAWPLSVVHVTDAFNSVSQRLSLTYAMSILSGNQELPRVWEFGEAQWFLEHHTPEEISHEALSAIKSRQMASFFGG